MRFEPLPLAGAFLIVPEPICDERGFFARMWCRREFAQQGLAADWEQGSVSHNLKAGTLRGLHFQRAPHEETKLVRCTAGAVFDVLLDLRRESPTYLQWCGVDLSAGNRHAVYIPKGVAHGFQTLVDTAEVTYAISGYFHADASAGVRWNDPVFSIEWPPAAQRVISPRDSAYPDYV